MRRCEEVRVELVAFAAGELSPADAEVVRTHLADCRVCTKLASQAKALEERLRGMFRAEPVLLSAAARSRLRARVLETAALRSPWGWFRPVWRPVLVTAGMATVVIVLWVVRSKGPSPQPIAPVRPETLEETVPEPPDSPIAMLADSSIDDTVDLTDDVDAMALADDPAYQALLAVPDADLLNPEELSNLSNEDHEALAMVFGNR